MIKLCPDYYKITHIGRTGVSKDVKYYLPNFEVDKSRVKSIYLKQEPGAKHPTRHPTWVGCWYSPQLKWLGVDIPPQSIINNVTTGPEIVNICLISNLVIFFQRGDPYMKKYVIFFHFSPLPHLKINTNKKTSTPSNIGF